MPDSRSHRGPHPQDEELFEAADLPRLRAATSDLSWLLSRGYNQSSALALVGNRYALRLRQRQAVSRAACSDDACAGRRTKRVAGEGLGELWVDGFNVLLTVEVALGGGPVFVARDGCLRDIASVHGTYRKVHETSPAVELFTKALFAWGIRRVRVLLDAPVSNSGRLAQVIGQNWEHNSLEEAFDWKVLLVHSPDEDLVKSDQIVASADGYVLDRARGWVNLARHIVEQHVPSPFLVDLSGSVALS